MLLSIAHFLIILTKNSNITKCLANPDLKTVY